MSVHIKGLVQDCSNSIANALELLQSCTKPSICDTILWYCLLSYWLLFVEINSAWPWQELMILPSALQSSLPAADDPSVGPATSAPPSRATIHSIASSSCDNDREPDRTTTDDALIPAPSSCYTAKLEESMNKDEAKDNVSMKFTPKPPPEPKPKSAGRKWLLLLRINPFGDKTIIFQAI